MYNTPDSSCRAFTQETFGVAFFSRGRGRGHAIPDMAIERELNRADSGVEVRFVSYSSGAQALKCCGHEVVDLGLADDAQLLELVVLHARVVRQLQPQLVVAHEELGALAAAQVFGIPSVFITDFFADPNPSVVRMLEYADEIVFTAEPGLYVEPPHIRVPITYVGPTVRQFTYHRSDRSRARRQLGLPADAVVVLCQPGNYSESQVPIVQELLGAWDLLPFPSRFLIWISARDFDSLGARLRGREGVMLLKEDWQMDRLMVASDLVLTKANRQTVYEAASLGIPSISISNAVNWPDDIAVARVRSNSALHVRDLASHSLAQLIVTRIGEAPLPDEDLPRWDGVARTARQIARHIERIRSVRSRLSPH